MYLKFGTKLGLFKPIWLLVSPTWHHRATLKLIWPQRTLHAGTKEWLFEPSLVLGTIEVGTMEGHFKTQLTTRVPKLTPQIVSLNPVDPSYLQVDTKECNFKTQLFAIVRKLAQQNVYLNYVGHPCQIRSIKKPK